VAGNGAQEIDGPGHRGRPETPQPQVAPCRTGRGCGAAVEWPAHASRCSNAVPIPAVDGTIAVIVHAVVAAFQRATGPDQQRARERGARDEPKTWLHGSPRGGS